MSFVPGTRIALVFGGRSPEHSISCVSAKSVHAALVDLGYEVLCIGITRSGNWVAVSPAEVAGYVITADHYPEVVDRPETIRLVMNAAGPGVGQALGVACGAHSS